MTTSARTLASASAWLCILIGACALSGWITGTELLKTFGYGSETLKANTAISFILSGTVLLLFVGEARRKHLSLVGSALAAVVLLLSSLILLQYVIGRDLGIDQLLFTDAGGIGRAPGRMAPNTALAFVFAQLGLVIFGLCGPRACGRWALLASSVAVLVLGLFSLVGYAANVSAGRQWGRVTVMSFPTMIGFLSLGVGLMGLIHRHGLLAWHLSRRQTVALLGGVITLIVVATLGWEASIRLQETSRGIVATANNRFLLGKLLLASQEIESGLRRSFVAGRSEPPPSVVSAQESLPRLLAQLESTARDPETRASLALIAARLTAFTAFSDSLYATLRDSGVAGVTERIRAGTGDQLLAEIHREIDALRARETDRIASLEQDAERWQRSATWVISFGGFLALVTITGGLVSLNHEAGQRQASETRFRGIFNSTFQFIGLLKPDGTLIEANQAALDFIGTPAAEVVGRPFWETPWWQTSLEVRTQLQDAIRRAAAGETVAYEVDVTGKDGRRITIQFSLKPVRNASGTLVYLVPEGSDITLAKQAERALAENEARWNFALTGSELGVWDWNAQTNEVFFSARWATMLGYQPEEIGRSLDEWSSRVHPDDLAPTLAQIHDHLEGRTPVYQSEHRMRAKDGSYRWILDQGKVITRDPAGKPLRVVGTHADITAQKIAEQQAATLQAQLTSILEFSPNLITLIDREGRYLLAGPMAAATLGRESPADVVGRSFHELLAPAVATTFAERLARMNDHPEAFEVEDVVPTPDGERIFQTQLFPIMDTDGRHVATGGIARDITDARNALKTVQAALAEREVLLREIHHRVKNNLQTISSLLNLQARSLNDPSLRSPFEDSRRRIMSMSLIHDQLYRHDDLARIDFARYVSDLVRLQRTTLGNGAGRISAEIAITLPPIGIAVAVPCGLIINELFANACKHAFPLGRVGTVRIHMASRGSEWELLVTDDGIGTPSSPTPTGSGLGLQLILALVKQLNGTLEESGRLDGRRTCIRFPAPIDPSPLP